MTWIKLDDKSPRHPKIAGLSDRAFRWWICGLCYASEFLTDGELPACFLATVPAKIHGELVVAGLWRNDGDRVRIHDYLRHQTSRAAVEFDRTAGRERAARSRSVRANAERTFADRSPKIRKPDTEVQNTDVQSAEAEAPRTAAPSVSLLRPLHARRNLRAAFEHPRFDVPDWWHLERVKGLPGGEAEMGRFYADLAAHVDAHPDERTEPRKAWLQGHFDAWLSRTAARASAVPDPEATRRMLAAKRAEAGR